MQPALVVRGPYTREAHKSKSAVLDVLGAASAGRAQSTLLNQAASYCDLHSVDAIWAGLLRFATRQHLSCLNALREHDTRDLNFVSLLV